MIALVTDSTAPLTHAEAEKFGICVVPHSYTVDGTAYLENYTDENPGYTDRLSRASRYATAQCTPSAFATAFRQLLAQGCDVLCIVLSSRLSGAWTSAVTAARALGNAHITVLDSHLTAGALYFALLRTREESLRGLSLSQLSDRFRTIEKEVGVAFSVEDMRALRRSHRLNFTSQSVNTILNRRPVFTLEGGAIVTRGQTRGRAERVRMLTQMVPENAKRLMVQGFGSAQIAASLAHMVRRRFPQADLLQRELGPVLSTHLGTQAVAVSWCLR